MRKLISIAGVAFLAVVFVVVQQAKPNRFSPATPKTGPAPIVPSSPIQASTSWQIYASPSMHFSIEYPSEWRVFGPETEAEWQRDSRTYPEYKADSLRVDFAPPSQSP